MKRIFLSILFTMTFFSYAQDFRDTYWGMDIQAIARTKKVQSLSLEELLENAYMLGENTFISYFFKMNKLKAVGYDVTYSKEKVNELKKKMTEKYGLPDKMVKLTMYSEEEKNEIKQKDFSNKTPAFLIYDDRRVSESGGKSATAYIINHADSGSDNDPIIFMHYRTSFSDIYVYADVVPGRIVVLYTEHVDDF